MTVPRDLDAIFRAGRTRRWHANAEMVDTCDFTDGHGGRVARLICALVPEPSAALLKAALAHDDGEQLVGDVPGDFKAANPGFARQLEDIERRERLRLWGVCPILPLSERERQLLKLCDRLDALMWVAWHRPALLARWDWQRDRGDVVAMAGALDLGPEVIQAIVRVIGGEVSR
ncbi:hypothetical protein [uncultured Jannaschia sp.]|uniref:hypothetical protein n=1 Tax=uncultured Jannaschia sp. TaxID=293347 RepID=UPI0026307E2C|nr:hypothetical protein [uncultured Jannaschia sp.]